MILKNKIARRLLRRVGEVFQDIRWQDQLGRMRAQATIDPTVKFIPEASILNNQDDPAAIRVEAHSIIHGQLLVFRHGGKIRMGSYVFLGQGSRVWSSISITIGDHVLISHNVNIHDNNAHPFDVAARREQTRFIHTHGALPPTSCGALEAAVRIDDDAWIGLNAVILKGVHIGRGAIVAAGSVVTHDVPAFTLVAGNPAVVKRQLEPDGPMASTPDSASF